MCNVYMGCHNIYIYFFFFLNPSVLVFSFSLVFFFSLFLFMYFLFVCVCVFFFICFWILWFVFFKKKKNKNKNKIEVSLHSFLIKKNVIFCFFNRDIIVNFFSTIFHFSTFPLFESNTYERKLNLFYSLTFFSSFSILSIFNPYNQTSPKCLLNVN